MMHGWKALIAKLNIVEDLQAALDPAEPGGIS